MVWLFSERVKLEAGRNTFPGNPFTLLKSPLLLVLCLSKPLVKISLPQFRTPELSRNVVMAENEAFCSIPREEFGLLLGADLTDRKVGTHTYPLVYPTSSYDSVVVHTRDELQPHNISVLGTSYTSKQLTDPDRCWSQMLLFIIH